MKKLVINPLRSVIIHADSLMMSSTNRNNKIILMRHAESIFNYEIKTLQKFKEIMQEEEFKKKTSQIRFSKDLLDCEITEKGKLECYQAGKQIDNINLKHVIVSPMRRALMTCEQTLSATSSSKPEVIVYPYIFEKIEDSCDILKDIHKNMRDFPHYNWKYFETVNKKENYQLSYCDVWPINSEYDQFKKKENKWMTDIPQDTHLDVVLNAMKILAQDDKYIESSAKTFERLSFFKNFINTFINDKLNSQSENEKVLIIGHSILFKHLTAKFIHEETHEPAEHSILQNCQLAEMMFL